MPTYYEEVIRGDLLLTGDLLSSGHGIKMPKDAVLSGPTGFIPRSAVVPERRVDYPVPITDMTLTGYTLTSPSWFIGGAGYYLTGTTSTNGTTVTDRASFLFPMPPEYFNGQEVRLSVVAKTSLAAVTGSGDSITADFEAWLLDGDGAIGSDLVTTAAQELEAEPKEHVFEVTYSGLSSGDVLLVRLTTTVTDEQQVDTRNTSVYRVAVEMDVKG